MKPPICKYELHTTSWRSAWSVLHEEAVAEILPCGCASHDYQDFDAQLQRLHPGLRLGFDLRRKCWIIYKWVNEMDRVRLGNDLPTLKYLQPIMDIVLTCEVVTQYRGKDGGWRDRYHAVKFGDWVLLKIARSTSDRFTRNSGWVEREVKRVADQNAAATDKRVKKNAEAWVNDCMSSADRGNPFFRRRQFRQKKIRVRHPLAKKVPA